MGREGDGEKGEMGKGGLLHENAISARGTEKWCAAVGAKHLAELFKYLC